ncbi:Bacterial Ig-like domain (group 2) [Candidatus Anstonella stagnisolia]|nr:Bacterial Ig-like domain (group 2) [Candidatus Anstonella stagnisolia]
MKFGVLFAFLLLLGALFAATAPESVAQTAAPPSTSPPPSTMQPSTPAAPPIPATATSVSSAISNPPSSLAQTSLPSSATTGLSGYVGEGLYKSKNSKITDSMLLNKNAIAINVSNSLQAARALPRRDPAQVYSCNVTPNDFLLQLGDIMPMLAECFVDGAQSACPQMGWQSGIGTFSNIGDVNATAVFHPNRIGNGAISVSSADGNYSCSASVIITMGNVTSLVVSPPSAYLPVGDSVQFSVRGFDDFNNSMVPNAAQVNWSAEGNAGTINPDGLFSALEEGNATVTARWNGLLANASVDAYISRTCNITPPSLRMVVGENADLNATCFDNAVSADCPLMNWDSTISYVFAIPIGSNTSATFQPLKSGIGTISAASADSRYSCSIPLEVLMGNITSVSIFPQNVTLAKGESVQFYVNASDDFRDSFLTTEANWSVQGTAGTINASGFFTAASEGNATVSALYNELGANASVGVYTIPQPPQAGGSAGSFAGAGSTPSSGGAVGSAAGVNAKRSCAGNPVEATVSEWGSTISGATVSLYLKEGGKTILVSQSLSDHFGGATLKTGKEGDYELVASKDGMREGRVSFYLSPCESAGSGSVAAAPGSLSFAQAAGSSIVLEKEIISANFARTFSVRKSVDNDGASSYYTDITTTYTNSAQAPLLDFEVAETVPSSVFSDVRSLAFTSYPRFSSTAPGTFYWKVSALSGGQKASYTYRIPRALSAEMISAFAAPSLLLNGEKSLNATVEGTKGTGVLAAVAAFAGAKDVSQLLELAGMTILALAVLFAAYTFFAGKKSQ